jgi:hypothetical protein
MQRASEDPGDLLDRELPRLQHLGFVRVDTRLHELRPTEQHARTMRPPQPLMALLVPVGEILRLLLRKIPRPLNNSLSRRPLAEEPRRKLLKGRRQSERLLHFLDPGHATQRTRLPQLRNVQHLAGREYRTGRAVDRILNLAGRGIPADLHPRRIKHREARDLTRPATEDTDEHVPVEEEADHRLLQEVFPSHPDVGCLHPNRFRPEHEPRSALTIKRVNRQRRDGVREQPDARIHRTDLQARVIRDDGPRVCLLRDVAAAGEDRLERHGAFLTRPKKATQHQFAPK